MKSAMPPNTPSSPPGPVMLEMPGWPDYQLIDTGDGKKLERFGRIVTVRPEEQAIWTPRLPAKSWQDADAVFTGDVEEEGAGRWRLRGRQPENWQMAYDGVRFVCRFTSFRHVGVFPEQAAHWAWFEQRIARAKSQPTVLNLFGYTGIASLVAAKAGARVTHVDASKKAIGWARENQTLSGLDDLPIRWICDDAVKFAAREVRRGRTYDAIILDPPKYGRGPKGEVWRLFEDLPELLDLCRALLTPEPLFVILTAYSIRASYLALEEVMRERFAGLVGSLDGGELILREAADGTRRGRALSTSLFGRWSQS